MENKYMNEMKRLAIFAGYDKDNIIDDYVVYYIKELKKIADIIYVSDCDMLDSELEKIAPYCIQIINGRHGEYDFGSYKRGYLYAYEKNILKDYDYLIFCNDSNFGPFIPFNNMFIKLEYDDNTIYGCFKHLEAYFPKNNIHGYYTKNGVKIIYEHLQSHFLIIPNKVFLSEWYYDFIKNIHLKEKDAIITNYEIGMGKLFLEHNVNMKSLYNEEAAHNKPYIDPLGLIKNGYPFLKKLRKDLTVGEIKSIFNIIKENYDINLIINYYCRFPDENMLCNRKKFQDDCYKLESEYILLKSKTVVFTFLQLKNWAFFSIIKDMNYIKIIFLGINIVLKRKKLN